MTDTFLLLLTIFAPLSGAFLLPLAGRASSRLRGALAFIFVLIPFALSAVMLPAALSGNPPSMKTSLPFGLSFGFMADGLAVFMALVSSFLGMVIVIYSYGYISHSENQSEYYMFVVMFIGAMMGITLTTDLIFLYIFWEISAVCCWRLIGFFREKEFVRRADKAFLITGGGALLMLGGFLTVYQQYGTTDLTVLKGREISSVAVTLILFGILSKSATLPFHSWIADAGVAPSPVTALLHAAVLVKIGVYVFTRLFAVNFSMAEIWHTAVPVIAAVSALLSAGAALRENDIKRIIAYSTVSQIGFILLGLSVGGELALAGGLLYIMMHAISKAGLFLCAGIVEHSCHTKDIREMGGLAKTMPFTAAAFFLCAFSVMGVPPFGGFFSKYMVVNGAVEAGSPWIAAVFLFAAVMTILYLLRVFAKVFLGNPRKELKPKEGSRVMVGSVVFLAALSIISGLVIYYPAEFVQQIVGQIMQK
ncbi:MAG: NADH-quinone oxidoreductase subunit L [Oscillospiraceae bacterium]|nr:NADH-quinone oxidoreductase subunit L [Oscillospiraceae bacterium]